MAQHEFKPLNYSENACDEAAVKAALGDWMLDLRYDAGQPVIVVDRAHWAETAKALRDAPKLRYAYFTDITAADLSERPDYDPDRRFQVVLILYSLETRRRIRVKCFAPESNPACPTLTGVFEGANLTEREAFEMFGITFTGHPNLKRLLTPDYMKHFPLRKDYPVTGRGERDNFPQYEELR